MPSDAVKSELGSLILQDAAMQHKAHKKRSSEPQFQVCILKSASLNCPELRVTDHFIASLLPHDFPKPLPA